MDGEVIKDKAKELARALLEAQVAGLRRAIDLALEAGAVNVSGVAARLEVQRRLNGAWAVANRANMDSVDLQRERGRAILGMLVDLVAQAALSAL